MKNNRKHLRCHAKPIPINKRVFGRCGIHLQINYWDNNFDALIKYPLDNGPFKTVWWTVCNVSKVQKPTTMQELLKIIERMLTNINNDEFADKVKKQEADYFQQFQEQRDNYQQSKSPKSIS